VKSIRVFTNFRTLRGLSGGANSFMRTLIRELEQRGYVFGTKRDSEYDLVFLNALSDGVTPVDAAYWKRERRLPVVHRKVGYTVSGGPEMREKVDGVPRGERIQMEFDPYVDFTIFQSEWSRDEFLKAGFRGDAVVIRNGVSSEIFHPRVRNGIWPWSNQVVRPSWKPNEPFRIAISSWSTDSNKGFAEYERLDRELPSHPGYEIDFFGRTPDFARFRSIRKHGALPHAKLAANLRRCHALLTLSRNETCSNSLIEAISCGLPAVFLDSGSNREIAEPYGVEYREDFWSSFEALKVRYAECFAKATAEPFRIAPVVDRYRALFERVLAGIDRSAR
jgi:glycosyltransferase involved in cell wall biosynthesis